MATYPRLLNPEDDSRPASLHAEQTILGAMLVEPLAIVDATMLLKADDFSLDSHRKIYEVMIHLSEVGYAVDIVTVSEELSKRKQLDSVGSRPYLAGLSEGLPRKLSIESYVRIVRDKSLMRQLMSVCDAGMMEASDQSLEAIDVLNQVESRLMEISEHAITGGFSGISDIVKSSFGSIEKLYEQGREVTGLRTHYTEFDKMTSGLQESELIIIAARPSMGKTAWAINIAQNSAVKDGMVVAVFSLEMSKESLLRRMLAGEASVGARKLQTGFLGRDDKGKLQDALERLMESKLYVDDTPGITLAEMRAKARRLKQQEGRLDLIVIDYLQLMSGSTGGKKGPENRTQEVSAVSRGLKALAKELRVPVVALSQLSRGSEQRTGDKKPLLSDLRESGSIEQDADVVCFIHREEYYDRENEDLKGKAEIIIAKQRNGPTGSVQMAYIADYTRFENLDTAHGGDGGY
ncbi:replicative DNA helicase [Granulicella tundricola]|uniref:Replicative DNA helicase n=1 Tax=Granulicella tundricola (strain ATCC BAA-1859 / DSM 23138 / MP5ACTX9) TaxID=1198114 RepID=E8WVX1_GRATM|nr:replicative DNA helicase [Granulicella tundricola]ADW70730.1 replicative DNA helicase [Granulicella tundricola MP5ACTX9]